MDSSDAAVDPTHRIATPDSLIAWLREHGIGDERVLEAMRAVPRERFVDDDLRDLAWEDRALPIASGQTISQPYIVALMTSALELTGTQSVLEIGTGSGYQAAVLAHLARSVVSLERHPALAEQAKVVLAQLGLRSVEIRIGDGTAGSGRNETFDRIIVTAAAPSVPVSLIAQLSSTNGRLIAPIGGREDQELILMTKVGERLTERRLGAVRFVPLVGDEGWPADQ